MPLRPVLRAAVLSPCFALAALACSESPSDTEPDPDPEPVIDVHGFHIMRGSTVAFEWAETDPAEADTLRLTYGQPIGVRFKWLDANGDSMFVPTDAILVVTTPDERYATWTASATPFIGNFNPGVFPEVETSFSVRLVVGNSIALNAPGLVLRVSPPS